MMRLLDLFCGAGGATRGYQLAGFHVRGVDHKPQPRYCGEEFVLSDALDYLRQQLERIKQ
jgi:DNA (cytosine-5)-methyltransferase 1